MSDDGSEKQCAICWEDLKPPSVVLECGHRFHYKCLSEWAKRSSKCPMCRQDFQSEEDTQDENNESSPMNAREEYYDFTQLYGENGEEMYWWQVACQSVAFFSTSITVIRFMALLFPHTIRRIFHPQIQAGEHLQSYFSYIRKHLLTYISTLLLACYLIVYPLHV